MHGKGPLPSVDFGRSKANAAGPTGVGFSIFDSDGNQVAARTTSGVREISPGIYSAANFTIPVGLSGSYQIVWDTGTAFPRTLYATETLQAVQIDDLALELSQAMAAIDQVSSSLGQVSSDLAGMGADLQQILVDVDLIKDYSSGRWRMHDNQMIFYKDDNVTEIARFDLFDDAGTPSMETVFERRKV